MFCARFARTHRAQGGFIKRAWTRVYVLCQSVGMDACDVMINAVEFRAQRRRDSALNRLSAPLARSLPDRRRLSAFHRTISFAGEGGCWDEEAAGSPGVGGKFYRVEYCRHMTDYLFGTEVKGEKNYSDYAMQLND